MTHHGDAMNAERAQGRADARGERAADRAADRQAREAARAHPDQAPAVGEGDPTGTRERIQAVALELFTEQGYDATSLREISERLGVTKAALYYHFRTKEDIIASLIADRIARLDELVDWSRVQLPTAENRRDLLRRYSELLYANGYDK